LIIFRTARRLLLVTFLTASLVVNVVFLTWEVGAVALSTAWTAITGTSAVVSSIVSKNKTLITQNTAFQSKITSNKATAKRITQRVGKRVAVGASRSASAVFAGAIPAVSTAVVVGVTAMELKDACETMKDLSELELLLEVEDAGPDINSVCGIEAPSFTSVKETVIKSPQAAIEALNGLDLKLPSTSELIEKLKLPFSREG
jgi:hypothetical protein